MKIAETAIIGCYVIEMDRLSDERGAFARAFCAETFADAGLPRDFPQCNLSYNIRRGTLRGMHFQRAPHEEGKLVRCVRGAIMDVAVDLRRESPTYLRVVSEILTADNGRALYLAPGLAHGFQTLEDNTDVFYQMSAIYSPGFADGIRWNDPVVSVTWPISAPTLSPRDATYPDWSA